MSVNPSDLVIMTQLTEIRQRMKAIDLLLKSYDKHPDLCSLKDVIELWKELTYLNLRLQNLENQINGVRKR